MRTGASARHQLEESLVRLKTDHIDLLQIHEVIRMGDPEQAFQPGNVMEVLKQARREGKIVLYTATFVEVEQEVVNEFRKRFPFGAGKRPEVV